MPGWGNARLTVIWQASGLKVKKAPTGDESWNYATLDGVLRLEPRLYLYARYNVALAGKLRGLSTAAPAPARSD